MNLLKRTVKLNLLYPRLISEKMSLRDYARTIRHCQHNLTRVKTGHIRFVTELTGANDRKVIQYLTELYDEDWFFAELDQKYERFMGQNLRSCFFEHSESSGSVFFSAVTTYHLQWNLQ